MDLDNFIITVFCQMDDALRGCLGQMGRARLRSRGPQPTLSDSEVLTMEVVGQYLGFSQDKAIFNYFRTHYSHFFPSLSRLHRTSFVRQAANLWKIKEQMWLYFLRQTAHDTALAFVDSFPLPVCRFARAPECKRLRELASFGRDSSARQTFYGLRVHMRVCWPGVITRLELAPAKVHELHLVPDLAHNTSGIMIGDRNYWAPLLAEQLDEQGVELLAPYRKATEDKHPQRSQVLSRVRQSIEVVFGQLCERFLVKRMWARDLWHLSSRLLRSVLAHTVCLLLNQRQGNAVRPLRLADLVS
jgi:hypothetical protein